MRIVADDVKSLSGKHADGVFSLKLECSEDVVLFIIEWELMRCILD